MEVRLIDVLGDDNRVTNAARISFHKDASNYTEEQNAKLIKYLADHNHHTPFMHVQITMYEKMPIYIARQRMKSVVGFSYNEVSRRYVDDEPEFYYPDYWRTRPVGNVKQGSGTEKLPEPEYIQGCCKQCGEKITNDKKGGREKLFCSEEHKYYYNNRNRNPYKNIWNNAKARANREGKEWSIDFDSFEFPEYCPILNIKLDYSLGKEKIQNNSPSFDRRDNSKQYVKDNVRIISHKANSMKSNATDEELVQFAKNILLTQKGISIDEEKMGYDAVIKRATKVYKQMIADGYAPEIARGILPQSMYTEVYATGSLAAWARAYKLRSDPHAQKEIRDLADMWNKIISDLPQLKYSWKALTE